MTGSYDLSTLTFEDKRVSVLFLKSANIKLAFLLSLHIKNRDYK